VKILGFWGSNLTLFLTNLGGQNLKKSVNFVSRNSVNLRGFQNPGIVGVLLKKWPLRAFF